MHFNKTLIGALALATSLYTAPALAVQYNFTDLGTLGGTSSWASDINNKGQVIGYDSTSFNSTSFDFSITITNVYRAFLYSNGSLQDLGTLGGSNTFALGINDSGQVVGSSEVAGNTASHAFLYSNGSMQDLDTLGGTFSQANGINNSGQVVGVDSYGISITYTPLTRAFLYINGNKQDLGTLGGAVSGASDINNNGQIVGSAQTSTDEEHAFIYNNGSMQDLGILGGSESFAFSLNDSGQVVGFSKVTGDTASHAFLYSNGSMQDLGTLGGSNSYANDINNKGQVVGISHTTGDSNFSAFLYSNGIMTDLNSFLDASTVNAGWVLGGASAINDNGWIVGGAYNTVTNSSRAFLLTPVPEADTYAMLLEGLGVLGWAKRRNQA